MHKVTYVVITTLLFAVGFSSASADQSEKLEFASALEETLGHFHALELNLDENNAVLAMVHATHPIAELYDLMRPTLQESDPELDAKIQTTLMELRANTVNATREDAQMALDDARMIIEEARILIVGQDLSNDPMFKLALMKTLLETSAAEYAEAVENGTINEMAEFQDGSAFVWRSQQIFEEIKGDLPEDASMEINDLYSTLWQAYDERADPSDVETLVGGLVAEIDEITGVESVMRGPETYFENIVSLLNQVKEQYANGMSEEALSLATKAYLDNYEFLEGPIAKHDTKLMEEIEVMLRQELRNMINEGVSSDKIDSHVDAIVEKLHEAAMLIGAEHEHKEQEYKEQEQQDMSPLQQVEFGIEPEDVVCDSGMELIIKTGNSSPACVKSETAERLIQLGWGTRPQ
ncbi:PEFG-CTERM sorting domain-containing protein [Candidatus Nitrosotenuis uzonensis]|uniref:Uncharacterized protein n=1 Tax=Candidatus Nitrosotenuis uzonensis TaxID=1407055 RepID=A0A812F3X9_9ARCH|nr:PEFG-CTERM sorting domain-containing protein [Candidatus Nitrosotenuis uzonensis]MCA2003315.1 PEFG-CTERM sorting domain-containing protein [Candidatus Nitrosotenuis sp.]CAE6501382.1 conserved exported hypothetical protein [Candidatus Nitrosotenuis uzonensis]